jgi:hypothetical protein
MLFFLHLIFELYPVSMKVILLTFQTSIVSTILRLGPFQTFLTIHRCTIGQKTPRNIRTQTVIGLKRLGTKCGKLHEIKFLSMENDFKKNLIYRKTPYLVLPLFLNFFLKAVPGTKTSQKIFQKFFRSKNKVFGPVQIPKKN